MSPRNCFKNPNVFHACPSDTVYKALTTTKDSEDKCLKYQHEYVDGELRIECNWCKKWLDKDGDYIF